MMDKNSWIFILNDNGLKHQQIMRFSWTKGIAFESASEYLWGADSRD